LIEQIRLKKFVTLQEEIMRVLVLFAMLICVSSVSANIIETGGYKFDFKVTNNWNKVFANDFYSINLNVDSNVAHVSVESPGYDINKFDLKLNAAQPVVKHTIVMAEPTIDIRVLNYSEQTLTAKVVKLPQTVAHNMYSFKVTIDDSEYSEFEWWDLTVKNFGTEMYSYNLEIKQTEQGRVILVTIPRLLIFSDEINDIDVVVPKNYKIKELRKSKIKGLKFHKFHRNNK